MPWLPRNSSRKSSRRSSGSSSHQPSTTSCSLVRTSSGSCGAAGAAAARGWAVNSRAAWAINKTRRSAWANKRHQAGSSLTSWSMWRADSSANKYTFKPCNWASSMLAVKRSSSLAISRCSQALRSDKRAISADMALKATSLGSPLVTSSTRTIWS